MERGKAPDAHRGVARANGGAWIARVRCARIRRWREYKGTGSIDDAANFVCVDALP